MPSTGFIPGAMDPLPVTPQNPGDFMPKPNVQPAQAESLPQGAGFVPKSGAAAFVASQLLNGWMAGRMIKAQREQQTAVRDVQQSKSVYDSVAQGYRDYIRGGGDKDSPEAKKMQGDLTHAWNQYLNSASKYSIPEEDKTKKKSVGQKVKSAVGGALQTNTDPHLYAQGALTMLRQSGPPDLQFTPSPEDKLAQVQLTEAEQSQKDAAHRRDLQKEWEGIQSTPEDKMTQQQRERRDQLERVLFNTSPIDQKKNQIMSRFLNGGKISEDEREAIGLKSDTSTSVMQDYGTGKSYIIAYDNKGNLLSKKEIQGLRGPSANDQVNAQVSAAKRIMEVQVSTMEGFLKKAHPEWTPTQVAQGAVEATYPQAKTLSDSLANEQKSTQVSNAIGRVLSASGGDAEKLKNFITMGPDGQYHYVTDVSNPSAVTGALWWKQTVFGGGAAAKDMPGLENQFRDAVVNQLTDEIMSKNKGMPKARAQAIARQMLPPAVYQDSGKLEGMKPTGMTPTPEQQQQQTQAKPQAMTPTPGAVWRAVGPDGQVIDDVTEEERQQMLNDPRFKGVKFETVNAQQTVPVQ